MDVRVYDAWVDLEEFDQARIISLASVDSVDRNPRLPRLSWRRCPKVSVALAFGLTWVILLSLLVSAAF